MSFAFVPASVAMSDTGARFVGSALGAAIAEIVAWRAGSLGTTRCFPVFALYQQKFSRQPVECCGLQTSLSPTEVTLPTDVVKVRLQAQLSEWLKSLYSVTAVLIIHDDIVQHSLWRLQCI